MLDSNLSWKNHVDCIMKKLGRNIGILSKIRYFVSSEILISLYYSLVYPFLVYGLIARGNTYESTLNPIFLLQKKAVHVTTFSAHDCHSSQLFKSLVWSPLRAILSSQVLELQFLYFLTLVSSRVFKVSEFPSSRVSAFQSFGVPEFQS